MLQGNEKITIPDQGGKNDLVAEVNWNEDPKMTDCKVIRLKIGDKTAYIKKEHLYSFLFAVGNKKEQRQMVPQKITKVRHYETTLYLKMTGNMKIGEILKVPVSIPLPSVADEVITELGKDKHLLKTQRDSVPSTQILIPGGAGKVEDLFSKEKDIG